MLGCFGFGLVALGLQMMVFAFVCFMLFCFDLVFVRVVLPSSVVLVRVLIWLAASLGFWCLCLWLWWLSV